MPVARVRLLLVVAATAPAAPAADTPTWKTVTFRDGFTLKGEVREELELVEDARGHSAKMRRADGFDYVLDGPKITIFSTHAQRGGVIDPAGPPPARTTYRTKLATRPRDDIRPYTNPVYGDWDAKWVRKIKTTTDDGPQTLTQQVTALDPYTMLVESPVEKFSMASHTADEDPKIVRKLLAMHPELRDPAAGPDPERRVKVAAFLKEVADTDPTRRALVWLVAGRRELADLRRDVPADRWPPAARDAAAKLVADLTRAEAGVLITEIEAAVKTGRYDAARAQLAATGTAGLDEALLTRLTVVRAAVEKVRPGFELTATRLRAVIDRQTGWAAVTPHAAVAGVGGVTFVPRPAADPPAAELVRAATLVLHELGPDTAERLELFRDAAGQAEAARARGQSPMDPPAALLAYAVSGWVRGKNGADADPAGAVRAWAVREMALDVLRRAGPTERKARIDAFTKAHGKPPAADELTQIITLLPPADPATGTGPGFPPVPPAEADGVAGIVRANTGPVADNGRGVNYVLRLPPEYHPGRAYPVLVALSDAGAPSERLVAALAGEAARNGTILASPVWVNSFGATGYDYTGKNHYVVAAVLRDVLRRFQADADRVFLFGFGAGASFAVDYGMAHPDQFAGVGGMCPTVPAGLALEYWTNAQRLPMYLVTGEVSGAVPNLRKLYDRWMRRGFPALLTIYRGRKTEWFGAEIPRLFDWMGRKTRVRGAASLRTFGVEPWQVLRESDDRYYWVGVPPGGLTGGGRMVNGVPKAVNPPHFTADIGRGGAVVIGDAVGVRKFTIWLDRDLIDWSAPLKVTINGRTPAGYKPVKLEPDIRLMLDEVYRTGDRKMLYLGKVEVSY